jgi:hypothetical protein
MVFPLVLDGPWLFRRLAVDGLAPLRQEFEDNEQHRHEHNAEDGRQHHTANTVVLVDRGRHHKHSGVKPAPGRRFWHCTNNHPSQMAL